MGYVSTNNDRKRIVDSEKYVDLIFESMTPVFKDILKNKIKEYEPDFIKKIEYIEDEELKGLLVYFIDNKTCWLLEGHNLSKNKFFLYKFIRNFIKDKNIEIFKVTIQKINKKIFKFYLFLGFQIVAEDKNNIVLEYRRQLCQTQ
jgi:hypothetical protein